MISCLDFRGLSTYLGVVLFLIALKSFRRGVYGDLLVFTTKFSSVVDELTLFERELRTLQDDREPASCGSVFKRPLIVVLRATSTSTAVACFRCKESEAGGRLLPRPRCSEFPVLSVAVALGPVDNLFNIKKKEHNIY